MNQGRIVVAEDDMENYQLVRFSLERVGRNVLVAVNSCDGVDGRKQQNHSQQWSQITLYAGGARTLPGERKRAMPARYQGDISKPVPVRSFLGLIGNAFVREVDGRLRPPGTKVSFKAAQPFIKNRWPVTCR